MNDWALITGASAGIGRELADVFAENHCKLVLLARDRARLEQLARDLSAKHRIETKVIVQDLSRADAARETFEAVGDIPVSILVNNAGFGWRGSFVEGDLPRTIDMMRVNMDALVQLSHRFAGPMVARRRGRILNVASTAAFQPGPFTTIYFATKAFVFSFSVALAEELAGTGVTVTTLCPGSTRTEFFERAGMGKSARDMVMMDARKVAEIGFRGLMRGQRIVIPGGLNKVTSTLARCAPAKLTAKAVRKINGQ